MIFYFWRHYLVLSCLWLLHEVVLVSVKQSSFPLLFCLNAVLDKHMNVLFLPRFFRILLALIKTWCFFWLKFILFGSSKTSATSRAASTLFTFLQWMELTLLLRILEYHFWYKLFLYRHQTQLANEQKDSNSISFVRVKSAMSIKYVRLGKAIEWIDFIARSVHSQSPPHRRRWPNQRWIRI